MIRLNFDETLYEFENLDRVQQFLVESGIDTLSESQAWYVISAAYNDKIVYACIDPYDEDVNNRTSLMLDTDHERLSEAAYQHAQDI